MDKRSVTRPFLMGTEKYLIEHTPLPRVALFRPQAPWSSSLYDEKSRKTK